MAKRQANSARASPVKKNQATKKGQQAKPGTRSAKEVRASGKSPTVKAKKQVVPTQEQIAERAKTIWQQRNCAPGEDERNRLEA